MAQTTALKDVTALVREDLEIVSTTVREALLPDRTELEPLLAHVGGYQGKQLRPAMVLLMARAIGGLKETHYQVAAIIEMIHMATLVHDDILDGALVRRSMPSLNAIHGHEVSVLLGDYLYAKAFHMSVCMPDQVCSRVLAEVTRIICQGEITQMLHRFDVATDEDLYFKVIREKTGVLYGAASELGASYAGANAEKIRFCKVFGISLGTAFQIIDDCLDVEGEEAVVGKSLGTDFGKGKLTLPFLKLYADLDDPGRRRFDEIFQDQKLEGRQETLIREFDLRPGLAYAHDRADDALREALNSLSGLPDNEYVDALRAMADFVLNRRN